MDQSLVDESVLLKAEGPKGHLAKNTQENLRNRDRVGLHQLLQTDVQSADRRGPFQAPDTVDDNWARSSPGPCGLVLFVDHPEEADQLGGIEGGARCWEVPVLEVEQLPGLPLRGVPDGQFQVGVILVRQRFFPDEELAGGEFRLGTVQPVALSWPAPVEPEDDSGVALPDLAPEVVGVDLQGALEDREFLAPAEPVDEAAGEQVGARALDH